MHRERGALLGVGAGACGRRGPAAAAACPPPQIALQLASPTPSGPCQVCEDCPALKLVRQPEPLSVSVEPGMPDGHVITFFEEGEPIIDGGFD